MTLLVVTYLFMVTVQAGFLFVLHVELEGVARTDREQTALGLATGRDLMKST